VQPGDRVAIFLDKTLEATVALFGAWIAGAVAVPINEGLRASQVRHILDDSGSQVLLSTARKLGGLEPAAHAGVTHVEVNLAASSQTARPARRGPTGRRAATSRDHPLHIGLHGRPKGILIRTRTSSRECASCLPTSRSARTSASSACCPSASTMASTSCSPLPRRAPPFFLHRSNFPPDICRALERFEITALAGVPTLWIPAHAAPLAAADACLSSPALHHELGRRFPDRLIKRYRESLPAPRSS